MLNDVPRNRAYRDALRQALHLYPNAVVLDIGGGTGLLSMYAIAAGASHVYCCEMSPHLCEIAKVCMQRNNVTNVTVIAKHSNALVVGSDLPQRVDIIVTELVDSGLLGEHIVTTLQYAKEKYLKPDGLMIPHSADVFGALISSPELACRQELLSDDDSSELHQLIGAVVPNEKYTCESLRNIVYTPLTESILLWTIAFSTHVPSTITVQWAALRDGLIDAIAYTYNLHLLPPHMMDVCVRSDESVVSGWDCAIVYAGQAGGRTHISRGMPIAYDMHVNLDTISFALQSPCSSGVENAPAVQQLGDADVASMNDKNYVLSYNNALNGVLKTCSRSSVDIVDISCNWITFGAMSKHYDSVESLVCVSISDEAKELFDNIWLKRHIENVKFHSLRDITGLLHLSFNQTIVIANIIESCGLVQQNGLKNIQFALHRFPSAIVLPSKISIIVTAVECSELYAQHRVCNENTLGV